MLIEWSAGYDGDRPHLIGGSEIEKTAQTTVDIAAGQVFCSGGDTALMPQISEFDHGARQQISHHGLHRVEGMRLGQYRIGRSLIEIDKRSDKLFPETG